jgi:serine/threonine protein kinase/tetratricopeptide (TPR) repeat protein
MSSPEAESVPDDLCPTPMKTMDYEGSGMPAPIPSSQPDKIGPYAILGELGEGGMGTVYLAEQREPVHRRVALKLIKLGMDTKELIARFEFERQALAMMQHPNVAAVLDVGTTGQGRPYFVMEYVPGIPITQYCDKHRLGVQQRLELFVKVCEGVQHAHQKGVIHRDLKPSNVLVMLLDGKAVPKVIDFGLAKLTTGHAGEHAAHTRYGQMVGTPAYMSPEQAEMSALDVDTRTDVYSLGAMLYELLVGAAPFDSGALRKMSYTELQRVLREEEPPRPSTRVSSMVQEASRVAERRHVEPRALIRALRGDMDWIVVKAIEKDRMRRYATPLELAADIQRHLNNEPVLARPPSVTYRLGKFVRKHKIPVAAAVAVLLALIAGLVATSVLYVQADAAKQLADKHRREAEAINNFLINEFLAEASPEHNPVGSDAALVKIVDKAAKKIDAAYAQQPELEAPLRKTLGETYWSLGRDDVAEPHLRRALELQRQARGPEDEETLAVANSLIRSLARLGRGSAEKRREANALAPAALDACRRVLGAEHPETLRAWTNAANMLSTAEDYAASERENRQILSTRRRVLGDAHRDTLKTMDSLAVDLYLQDKFKEAEGLYQDLLKVRKRTLGSDHPDTLNSQHNLVLVLTALNRRAEAQPLAEQTLASRRHVLGPEHTYTLASISALANLLYLQGRFSQAEDHYRELAEICRRTQGSEHEQTLQAISNRAKALVAMGKLAEGERIYSQYLDTWRRKLGASHSITVGATIALANMLHKQNRLAEAEPLYREILALPGEGHLATTVYAMNGLANLLLDKPGDDAGALAEAEIHCKRALDRRREKLAPTDRYLADSLQTWGRVHLKKNQAAAAEPHLREAVKIYRGTPRDNDYELASVESLLGACLAEQGRHEEAEPLLLGAHTRITQFTTAPPLRLHQATERVVRLYALWKKAEKEAEWRARLEKDAKGLGTAPP